MKRLAFLFLAFASFASFAAHAAYDCFPSTWVPVPGLGTPYRTTTLPYGYSKAWFCQLPAQQGTISGKTYWSVNIFPVHRTDENLTIFKDALTRVLGATDMLKQANIEVQTANVVLVPGSQKEYEYRMLRYTACKDLQLQTSWPTGVIFDRPATEDPLKPSIYATGWCGQQPVPPVTTAWVTSGTSSYNTLNGALSSYAGSIAKGLACDDSVVVRVGTITYKHFAGASKPTIVAQCKAP